jgi:hypothetical protein
VARFICALSLLGLALLPVGCYATAGAYTEAEYVDVEVVPAHVEVYPHYYYQGRTVYLVDGHWYYRRGPHWVYYRQEPPELYRHRVYVERAPRARERSQAHHHRRAHPAEDRD